MGRHVQSSLRDGRIGRVTVPSDKSLGYCHTTLRVEVLSPRDTLGMVCLAAIQEHIEKGPIVGVCQFRPPSP